MSQPADWMELTRLWQAEGAAVSLDELEGHMQRERAVMRMRRALSEYIVTGIRTNLTFHQRLFSHPDFVAGKYDTGFVERCKDELVGDPPDSNLCLARSIVRQLPGKVYALWVIALVLILGDHREVGRWVPGS